MLLLSQANIITAPHLYGIGCRSFCQLTTSDSSLNLLKLKAMLWLKIWVLQENDYDLIVCEHKDRLSRVGFNYLKVLLTLNL